MADIGFFLSTSNIMFIGLAGGAVLGTLVGLVVCLSWKLQRLRDRAILEEELPGPAHVRPIDRRRKHNDMSFISLITDDEYSVTDKIPYP